MSNETSPPSPPSPTGRRASFVPAQKLSELFGKTSTTNGGASGVQTYPGSIAAAAANAQAQQRRRMSISTLGLSGSPTQTSPFTSSRPRQESYSSNGSGSGPPSVDESAIEDGEAGLSNSSTSPFARRMSFGARALRDVKGGNGSFNGEGFNWSEQLRTRAQRSSSITSPPIGSTAPGREHQRAASVASVEAPLKEMPRAPKVPDHFQERILKGDFYMD